MKLRPKSHYEFRKRATHIETPLVLFGSDEPSYCDSCCFICFIFFITFLVMIVLVALVVLPLFSGLNPTTKYSYAYWIPSWFILLIVLIIGSVLFDKKSQLTFKILHLPLYATLCLASFYILGFLKSFETISWEWYIIFIPCYAFIGFISITIIFILCTIKSQSSQGLKPLLGSKRNSSQFIGYWSHELSRPENPTHDSVVSLK